MLKTEYWVHASTVKVLKRLQKEKQIDQELDFTVKRVERNDTYMKKLMQHTKLFILLCALFSHAIYAKPSINEPLSIWSWNVWFDQASSAERYPIILNQLYTASPDVVFLQEVTPTFIDQFHNNSLSKDYHLFTTPNAKRSYGLAYLSKKRFEFTEVASLNSKFHRTVFLALLITSSNKAYVFINVHLESGQTESEVRGKQIDNIHHNYLPAFIANVTATYPHITIAGTLWGGDFNIDGNESHKTLSQNWIDAAVYNKKSEKVTYDVVNNLLAKKTAGWFEGASRLDRFYLNAESPLKFRQYSVLSTLKGQSHPPSDHFPIIMQVE